VAGPPEVVELSRAPALGGLYRRALLTRHSGTNTLPGTTLVLRDVGVDRDRLTRYSKTCGYRLGDLLPPTYPHVLAFPLALDLLTRRDFPFPVVGLVHVANRIEVLRPVDAGERLELTVRAADLREHPRGRAFDVRATASVGDEVVWRGVSTYLRKERRAAAGPRDEAAEACTGMLWRVGREVGTAYARVSGDRNPIHTSRLAARAFGYPGPIAHGMWTAARCLAALEGRLPGAYAVEVAFRRPIVLPARVCFTGTATEHRRADPAQVLAHDAWTLTDARTGATHLTGQVTPA
jgi:acyl dehydratase